MERVKAREKICRIFFSPTLTLSPLSLSYFFLFLGILHTSRQTLLFAEYLPYHPHSYLSLSKDLVRSSFLQVQPSLSHTHILHTHVIVYVEPVVNGYGQDGNKTLGKRKLTHKHGTIRIRVIKKKIAAVLD